jgi:hypothetical protein
MWHKTGNMLCIFCVKNNIYQPTFQSGQQTLQREELSYTVEFMRKIECQAAESPWFPISYMRL